MSRNKSFAEIVAEAKAMPPRERVVRPGGFNHDGDLFDPAGNLLEHVRSVTPKQAQVLVAEGAAVAFEGCGCGGGPGGCKLQWVGTAALGQMGSIRPRFVRGFGSPTWIDLWQGDAGFVVSVHGDVQWGDAW